MSSIGARRERESRARLLAALLGAVLAVAVAAGAARPATTSARAGEVPRALVPRFSHVVVIVLENKEYGQVVGRSSAPTFGALARRYALLTDYRAVAHPSLPNYLALLSGSTQGITSDCTSCAVDAPNLADTLARAGKSWKTYAEGLPYPGFTGASAGRYAKKHDPFLYFRDVSSNPVRLRDVVPLTAFQADLRAGRLLDFSLVLPDLCHDMHDCPVSSGDAWLAAFLRPLLSSRVLTNGVVFVVFDEGRSSIGGGGHVAALVLGPTVRPGARLGRPLNHYSLLRTIEQSWRLTLLGHSAAASPITGIWRSARGHTPYSLSPRKPSTSGGTAPTSTVPPSPTSRRLAEDVAALDFLEQVGRAVAEGAGAPVAAELRGAARLAARRQRLPTTRRAPS